MLGMVHACNQIAHKAEVNNQSHVKWSVRAAGSGNDNNNKVAILSHASGLSLAIQTSETVPATRGVFCLAYVCGELVRLRALTPAWLFPLVRRTIPACRSSTAPSRKRCPVVGKTIPCAFFRVPFFRGTGGSANDPIGF